MENLWHISGIQSHGTKPCPRERMSGKWHGEPRTEQLKYLLKKEIFAK